MDTTCKKKKDFQVGEDPGNFEHWQVAFIGTALGRDVVGAKPVWRRRLRERGWHLLPAVRTALSIALELLLKSATSTLFYPFPRMPIFLYANLFYRLNNTK